MAIARRTPPIGLLRLGSWTALVHADSHAYGETLGLIFKGCFRPAGGARPALQATIDLQYRDPAGSDAPAPTLETPVLRCRAAGTVWEMASNVLAAYLFAAETPPSIVIVVNPAPEVRAYVTFHLTVALHKLLLLLGRLYVHAGAVCFRESVSVFVGDKGAGKSTLCLWLGGAGGTVLADDHVLLTRASDGVLASGCEETARVTAATERFLFPAPLPVPAVDYGGLVKKEFPIADRFRSAPHRDYRVDRLLFTRVGHRLAVTPLTRQAALLSLVRETAWCHRFVDARDYAAYLRYLAGLVDAVDVFDLELSPDLSELARLSGLLEGVHGPTHG
jgi:hypothetical protein